MKNRVHLIFAILVMLELIALLSMDPKAVTLAWHPSPETNITTYRLYWGPFSRHYTNSQDVGKFTNAVAQIPPPVYFAVTVITPLGESAYSNEVLYGDPPTNTPPAVTNFIYLLMPTLQMANSITGPWATIASYTNTVETTNTVYFRMYMAFTYPMYNPLPRPAPSIVTNQLSAPPPFPK